LRYPLCWAVLLLALNYPMHAAVSSDVRLEDVRIEAIDPNYAVVSGDVCGLKLTNGTYQCNDTPLGFAVNDSSLKLTLQEFHVGDHLRMTVTPTHELEATRGFWSINVSVIRRIMVLALFALVLGAIAMLCTRGAPLGLIVGTDNRYSNSKLQIALWFWVLLTTYLTTCFLRVSYAGWDFLGNISIPENLLALSAFSAVTFGGAKAITTAKAGAAEANMTALGAAPDWQATHSYSLGELTRPQSGNPNGLTYRCLVAGTSDASAPSWTQASGATLGDGTVTWQAAVAKTKAEKPNFINDLFQNDLGQFDFGDFQMIIVTLVTAILYLLLVFHSLSTIEFRHSLTIPDVDSTLLTVFGLGHGAYLAKKAGGNVGS
jgi:hypothetical protein